MFILGYTVLRIDDELLNERSKPGDGRMDKPILLLSSPLTIILYITGGP